MNNQNGCVHDGFVSVTPERGSGLSVRDGCDRTPAAARRIRRQRQRCEVRDRLRAVYARVIDNWLGGDSVAILGGNFRNSVSRSFEDFLRGEHLFLRSLDGGFGFLDRRVALLFFRGAPLLFSRLARVLTRRR